MKQILSLDDLKGLFLVEVIGDISSTELNFKFSDGNQVKMYHSQDCCEDVEIVDIDGDLQDLVGGIVTDFSERTSSDFNVFDELFVNSNNIDIYESSFTWTFYHITTSKASVIIRWLGQSNGYYSEDVDIKVWDSNKWRTVNVRT